MGLGGLIVVLVALGAVLFWLLDRHENRRAAAGKPRHSWLRIILAAAALLLMLFAGGCAVLFLGSLWSSTGGQQYFDEFVVLIFAGPPFAVGLLVWWLAMRRAKLS